MFSRAFHIVKSFILLGTKNTAADLLIQWFGPEDLKRVVGGERWWQVRGLDGIDAEWIAEKSHLRPESDHIDAGRKYSEEERLLMSMEQLETTMLYIHGGGYYWGSINTHRYQIIKYAHKIRGRAFTVNYRKAPQYPWPCPLHDVLAAYLYLIQPPHDAAHKPIPPSKIVFAGDSAGGALCLAMLTVLRDLGQPLPAGAVLISPWVDLTHSFPSIHTNTATDIIPPHGFMNKPSVLWPVDPIKEGGRVLPTDAEKKSDSTPVGSKHQLLSNSASSIPLKSQQKTSLFDGGKCDLTGGGHGRSRDQNRNPTQPPEGAHEKSWRCSTGNTVPDTVLCYDRVRHLHSILTFIDGQCPRRQLSHPLVSPILQASLGNLCPLYILAGDGEVLRDEITYLTHKAANPAEYPVREGVIRDGLRQKENAHKFSTPTKVHLQVYDGMCHVLTVFTFTSSADYAYNSIAEFAKHVTQRSAEYLDRYPFLVLQPIPGSDVPSCAMNDRSGDILMIRERVDIHGRVRSMEPKEDIAALQLRPSEIGIIKEETLFKWLEGQEEWDRRFKYCATKVMKNRKTIEAKAKSIIKKARQRGLSLAGESDDLVEMPIVGRSSAVYGAIQEDRRWGPLDLVDEQPPPTAIAARRDTRLLCLRRSIYHTAPATHKTIPRVKTVDVVLAAFDPNDSVSEQQVRTGMRYIHGMRMWQSIVR
ncbi:alpha beta-hydrolase [Suillus discolor]|uniref:Alpha beta-hydrolase n=1 Tax=Suillus discolor TaxID=1912936 RepID=A0A9P7FFF0_9AGAM|nr:alpha beta-hydrolase [Suillus discolor]KAG2116013.1 alpha beta-hydrolase [Suillus discolor]